MSKQKLEQRKKRKKEQRRKEKLVRFRETIWHGSHRDDDTLEQAAELLDKHQYRKARTLLLPFVEKHPKWIEPLEMLTEACDATGDHRTLLWATERLIQLDPDNFNAYARHNNACFRNEMPASMVRTIKEMQRRFPKEDIGENAENILTLEPEIIKQIRIDAEEMGDDLSTFTDGQLLEFKQEQERCLQYLRSHRFETVVQICDRLIARFPFFRSAYNNKALAILLDQGAEQADRALNEALEHHPDNVYALAFKIRQLAILGRGDETPPLLERLQNTKPLSSNKIDHYLMQMEAFAWARNEDLLIKTFHKAQEDTSKEWDIDLKPCEVMTHLAATAHALRGERYEAIQLWKKVENHEDAELIALENLADIIAEDGKRNGPWYFGVDDWIPCRFFTDLIRTVQEQEIDDWEDTEEQEKLTEQHILPLYMQALKRWPYLKTTLLEMLRYGDEQARNWVRMTINKNSSPELVAALREFVVGPDGTDECRFGLINEMSKYGFLEGGRMTRWSRGKQDEQYVFAFEISYAPNYEDNKLSKQGLREAGHAFELLRSGREQEALELLEKVNAREPDDRSVLFNMAACKKELGFEDEYRSLIDRVAQLYPNYFFAKNSLARIAIQDKRPDDAFPILMELLNIKRLHFTEAAALFNILTMYHLAKGETSVAKSVHDIAKSMIDDDLIAPLWQLQEEAGVKSNFFDRLRSLVRK